MLSGTRKTYDAGDTIVGVASPPGVGAVALIRISGQGAWSIAEERIGKVLNRERFACVALWRGTSGEILDKVVVTGFLRPSSYTGEDVVEICGHGNPLVVDAIVESVLNSGARLAGPGEFTLRAVCNGKLDLLQAEGVRDFTAAQNSVQAKLALRQMQGGLSARIRPLKTVLTGVVARMEAGIDFADDDVGPPDPLEIAKPLTPVAHALSELVDSFEIGRRVSQGIRLAIVGKPNVGKSSVFNALLRRDRAIVTEVPGTTRDVLTEVADIDGVPVRLADTAGLRPTTDAVEVLGIERTRQAIAEADYVLAVFDAARSLDDDDSRVLRCIENCEHLKVINKCDLVIRLEGEWTSSAICTSAATGEGIDVLRRRLRAALLGGASLTESVITDRRQFEHLRTAHNALSRGIEAVSAGTPDEMILVDLYEALAAFGQLSGEVVTDDILNEIFSTFCIGK